ncbi:MAG TPA: hypothetical protein VF041_23340 [Gemmatimonadaceae bacterium]
MPAPPPGGPDALVAFIAQQTGMPPAQIVPLVRQFLATIPPPALRQFFSLPLPDQALALVNGLGPVPNGPPGMAPGLPPGPPPGPAAAPPNGPPVGAPPGIPVGAGPLPMPGPMPGPMPAGGGPPAAPPAQRPPREKKPSKPKLPPFELPEVPERAKPTYAQIIADEVTARRLYRARDERIKRDYELYYQIEQYQKPNHKPADRAGGDYLHTSSTPSRLVHQIIGRVMATHDNVTLEVDAPDDSDDSIQAAQNVENFLRTCREVWENRWAQRGSLGDPQPMLNWKEAGLMVVEGALGGVLATNPDYPQYPQDYEPVPVQQLYPLSHATLRCYRTTLGALRVEEPAVRKLIPEYKADDPLAHGWYADDQDVEVIGWSDEVWHAVAFKIGPPADPRRQVDKELWVKEPREHGAGFRIYQYPPSWAGTPGPAMRGLETQARRFAGAGLLTFLHPTFTLLDQLISLTLTQAMKATNPPVIDKIDKTIPDEGESRRDPVDVGIGGRTHRYTTDEVEFPLGSFAGNADANTMFQSVLGEINNYLPPVLGGRGPAQSGFDRAQQDESAGASVIDPIIDALEAHREMFFRLSCELALRTMKTGKGRKPLYKSLEYRSYRDAESRGSIGTVSAKDFETVRIDRTAPGIRVRWQRMSMVQRMQLSNLMVLLVKEKLKSRFQAMRETGVVDPRREEQLMLTEAAFMDDKFLKTLIGAAVRNLRPELYPDWVASEPPPQPPAEKGLPSPPGAPAPGLPPAMTQGPMPGPMPGM